MHMLSCGFGCQGIISIYSICCSRRRCLLTCFSYGGVYLWMQRGLVVEGEAYIRLLEPEEPHSDSTEVISKKARLWRRSLAPNGFLQVAVCSTFSTCCSWPTCAPCVRWCSRRTLLSNRQHCPPQISVQVLIKTLGALARWAPIDITIEGTLGASQRGFLEHNISN